MILEKRAIKFYLDDKVNKAKKEKLLKFLNECQNAQNQMYTYFWDNFNVIIECKNKLDINSYANKNNYRVREPRLKSHHHQQVLQSVFANLKSLESNIVNKIRFKFDNNEKQRIYNYLAKFCFQWDKLERYVDKQIKSTKDAKYKSFLIQVRDTINNIDEYEQIKDTIESKFYEIKSKYKCPEKKELQIQCNSTHTIREIQMKEFQWVFVLDTNTVIGGDEKRGIFEKLPIPVKFSDYHKEVLTGKKLANTFNIKLNKYGKIEIIGVYDAEVEKKENEITDTIGVDIGLNKLITASDGEVVSNNKKIIKKLTKQSLREANRNRLQAHLQSKLNNEDYRLSDKNFQKQRNALLNFIKCDTRHRIKNFLKDRLNTHIIIEDLDIVYSKTWSKEVNRKLRRMHIQRIKDYLIKYCNDLGIKITQVNSAFTSQQCSSCSHIDKDSRVSQEMFSCVKCSYEINADINASNNIKNRIKYKEIKLNTPIWRVKEVLMN